MQFPITPYKIQKAFRYWKHFGTKEFMNRLRDRMEPETVPYGPWFEQHRAHDEELKKQRNHPIPDAPWISVIVPAYRTPERYFTQMVNSVLEQSYSSWELVIADAGAKEETEGKRGRSVAELAKNFRSGDARVCYVGLEEN